MLPVSLGTGLGIPVVQNRTQEVTAILSQALPAAGAKKQFDDLVRLVERLGQINIESRYLPREYRVDVLWKYEK